MTITLIAYKKVVALPSVPRASSLSFLKADPPKSCPPIQAFWKAKDYKDRVWHVTSCNFRFLVKNNFNACVVVFFFIKYVLCSTLLVPIKKLVPPVVSSDILQTNIFGTRRFSFTHLQNLTNFTKVIWIIIIFKLGGLLIYAMQEEIQTLRKLTEQI